jgi:hypothetical protein
MHPELPREIVALESFLHNKGFVLTSSSPPNNEVFGNRTLTYTCGDIGVRMELDRGRWSIQIADLSNSPETWYRAESIRELLLGVAGYFANISEEKGFIESNWVSIVGCFESARREATHLALDQINRDRLNRAIPIWPQAILDFEEFAKSKGFICQCRLASAGTLGKQKLEYSNGNISIRIEAVPAWRVRIADLNAHPNHWYDVRVIQAMFPSDQQLKHPFLEWFKFLMESWRRITDAFCPALQEQTHKQLGAIQKDHPEWQ